MIVEEGLLGRMRNLPEGWRVRGEMINLYSKHVMKSIIVYYFIQLLYATGPCDWSVTPSLTRRDVFEATSL